uniref:Uncharacterized protein n=1 Tax=Physcomitrium patens TaxID=3218 RepID=A0A7I3Z4P9_PHYPA
FINWLDSCTSLQTNEAHSSELLSTDKLDLDSERHDFSVQNKRMLLTIGKVFVVVFEDDWFMFCVLLWHTGLVSPPCCGSPYCGLHTDSFDVAL